MRVARAHWSVPLLCAVVLVCGGAALLAQEGPLAKARALYDSAAYEEALTVLASLEAPQAQQYRALCLLALGRTQDAKNAVDLLVSGTPLLDLSSEDVPPRFVTLVSEAKKRLVPAIARKTFNEGRDQYRSGEREQAVVKFDLVLSLTEMPGFKETDDAEDLRTLASGFIDLARATAAARPEPKAADSKAAESTSPAGKASEPAAPPALAGVAPAAGRAADIVQAVAIRQTIPAVPSGIAGLGGPTAAVKIAIGPDGKVMAAAMQQTSHPLYDRMVLQAARDWLYTPATLNGKPVASEKVVSIQLR
jgi:Gram-negative bacterial TonB protein C-terminal